MTCNQKLRKFKMREELRVIIYDPYNLGKGLIYIPRQTSLKDTIYFLFSHNILQAFMENIFTKNVYMLLHVS